MRIKLWKPQIKITNENIIKNKNSIKNRIKRNFLSNKKIQEKEINKINNNNEKNII